MAQIKKIMNLAMTMKTVSRNNKYFLGILLSTLFVFGNGHAASYPDFTKIVEDNMPAVVIVNATRSSNISNKNEFKNPPGMPDEFNDFFKKFLMKDKMHLKEVNQVLVQVLFYQAMDIL